MKTQAGPSRSVCLAGEKQDSGTEQHGKDGHELLVREEVARIPYPCIHSVKIAIGIGIQIGGIRHGEALNVHDQDAQDRHAA
ncbi:MAG: hypothetical protein ABIK28_22800 [Planctomycetota bacterium]